MNLKDIQLNKDHKLESLNKKFGVQKVLSWILAGDIFEVRKGFFRRLY